MTRRLNRLNLALAVMLLLAAVSLGMAPVRVAVSQDLPGVSGDTYSSPSFGFSLTWDESWSVVTATASAAEDRLELTNGVSTMSFRGYGSSDDPEGCVAEERSRLDATPGVTDRTPALDGNGAPLAGSDEIGAYATDNFMRDGVFSTFYIDCRPIAPGRALLAITQVVPQAEYNAQIEPRGALLDQLTIGTPSDSVMTSSPMAARASAMPPTIDRLLLEGGSVLTIHDGLIFTHSTARQTLEAVDDTTLEVRWTAPVEGSFFNQDYGQTGPLIEDDLLFVVSSNSLEGTSTLIALGVRDGAERWRAPDFRYLLDSDASSIYAMSTDNKLVAIDAATGAERWRYEDLFETGYYQFEAEAGEGVLALVAAQGMGSLPGLLIVLDAATGDERWSHQTEGSGHMGEFSRPAISASQIIVDEFIDPTADIAAVYALDIATGDERWRVETGLMAGYQIPIADGTAYVFASTGLHAIDAASGTLLWTYHDAGNFFPVIYGDTLFARNDRSLTALDITSGAEIWQAPTAVPEGPSSRPFTPEDAFTTPLLVDGVIYAGNGMALSAIDAATGTTLWRARTGGLVTRTALTSDNHILVVSEDGYLYRFEPVSKSQLENAGRQLEGPEGVTSLFASPIDPAVAGFDSLKLNLWRVRIAPGALVELPAVGGAGALFVESGAIEATPGLPPIIHPVDHYSMELVTSLSAGDQARLPFNMRSPVRAFNGGASLLIGTIMPAAFQLAFPDIPEVQVEALGNGSLDGYTVARSDLSYISQTFELMEIVVPPGMSLVPNVAIWPSLIVVESGGLHLTMEGAAAIVTNAEGVETEQSTMLLTAGDRASIPSGSYWQGMNADQGPLRILVLSLGGRFHILGGAGGCGGRCMVRPSR